MPLEALAQNPRAVLQIRSGLLEDVIGPFAFNERPFQTGVSSADNQVFAIPPFRSDAAPPYAEIYGLARELPRSQRESFWRTLVMDQDNSNRETYSQRLSSSTRCSEWQGGVQDLWRQSK